ncbi:C-X-C chemokine receptor type 1-like [Melanotaenia boesemani]|uniref:C-X-C chemokine receptor type 1-like n=1 Tax=Melanotaenia boesemani TaxID=1250792 RepID=UPI001C04B80E|nr:C-X-C chemokine receptor type 1-like [Melanotaenia boesemani]
MYLRKEHYLMAWISICTYFPLALVVICCLCYKARRDHVPVYYINLIISNLIQLYSMRVWVTKENYDMVQYSCVVVYIFSVMTSLGFRMCIALERYFVIVCPQLPCIRQIKGSVWVCVAVWGIFLVTVPLPLFFGQPSFVLTLALLPAPVFIICLAGTLKSVLQTPPAAASVPAEEKRRILGILVLLLLNYILTILPAAIMRPIDKLLMRLCCCRMQDAAAGDGSTPSV